MVLFSFSNIVLSAQIKQLLKNNTNDYLGYPNFLCLQVVSLSIFNKLLS